MKIKKIIAILVSGIILLSVINPMAAAKNGSYSWYCKREKDNKQPMLPYEFDFITKYDVLWCNTKRKDSDINKIAYLTFDAGYENGNISKILDVLAEKDVKGAFFILKNLIESNPELVIRMESEGHLVCNHTANHKNMSKVRNLADFEKELSLLDQAYVELTGNEIKKFYRPPEGSFSEQNLRHAKDLGYITVFWSFAYADWDNNNQPSYEYAKRKILDNIHNGAVMLLHPTSNTNAEILGEIIDIMRKEGYEFGTLDELYDEISLAQ